MREAPAVSVVVPTYRRPELLSRCLAALVTQNVDWPFEIVVADDAGEAETERVVGVWAEHARGQPRVEYLRVSGSHGPAAARNQGWRRAHAALIAFTDDDTIAAPDWLREGHAVIQDDIVAAAGFIRVPVPEQPSDYELDASHLNGAEFATANCFVLRSALEAIDGFDERFRVAWREDSDLYFSLLQRGYRVARAEKAVVLHPVRPASWGVSLRQQRKVYFDGLLYKKHPQLFRAKVRQTPPWHYFAIVAALITVPVALPYGAHGLAFFAAGSWAALTAAFCWRRLRHTRRTPDHVLEMIITSIAIPPTACFWRLLGVLRFRVLFP